MLTNSTKKNCIISLNIHNETEIIYLEFREQISNRRESQRRRGKKNVNKVKYIKQKKDGFLFDSVTFIKGNAHEVVKCKYTRNLFASSTVNLNDWNDKLAYLLLSGSWIAFALSLASSNPKYFISQQIYVFLALAREKKTSSSACSNKWSSVEIKSKPNESNQRDCDIIAVKSDGLTFDEELEYIYSKRVANVMVNGTETGTGYGYRELTFCECYRYAIDLEPLRVRESEIGIWPIAFMCECINSFFSLFFFSFLLLNFVPAWPDNPWLVSGWLVSQWELVIFAKTFNKCLECNVSIS